jgi:hypothetical protein
VSIDKDHAGIGEFIQILAAVGSGEYGFEDGCMGVTTINELLNDIQRAQAKLFKSGRIIFIKRINDPTPAQMM